MPLLRSTLIPHVLFLALLLLIGVLCAVRFSTHFAELDKIEAMITKTGNDLRVIDDIHLVLGQFAHDAEIAAAEPGPESLAIFTATSQRFLKLTDDYRARRQRRDIYAAQMFRLSDRVRAKLEAIGEKQPSSAEMADLAERIREMRRLWSSTSVNAARDWMNASEKVLKQGRRTLMETGTVVAILLCMGIMYLYVVNLYLARPVRRLAETVQMVSGGNLRARAPADIEGVVGDLAADFNNMVDILVESLRDEEKAVFELRKKTRQLEEANRHKSQFLANVSHELKTPLGAIIGFADVIAIGHHGPLTPRQEEYVRRIYDSGIHLKQLISDLMDIAKIDVGRMELNLQEVEVSEVIDEVMEIVAERAREKEQVVAFEPGPEPIRLALDRLRFKQVVLNLVVNAIKFTPANGTVKINAQVNNSECVVAVADSGIGIDKRQQARIFEDFVQLDSELGRKHEGTGIGLALCRRLVQLMNGRIWVDSVKGKGSTFTVAFPVRGLLGEHKHEKAPGDAGER